MADSRDPSARRAAIRKARPATLLTMPSRRRLGAARRGHQCRSTPSDQAVISVARGWPRGRKGIMTPVSGSSDAQRGGRRDPRERGQARGRGRLAPDRRRHDVPAAARPRGGGLRRVRRAVGLRAAARGAGRAGAAERSPRGPSWPARSRSARWCGRGSSSGALAAAVALAAVPGGARSRRAGDARRARRLRLAAAVHRWMGPRWRCSSRGSLLSGWGEFLGVALRCRRARRSEAVLLLVLRAGALVFAAVALVGGRRPARRQPRARALAAAGARARRAAAAA